MSELKNAAGEVAVPTLVSAETSWNGIGKILAPEQSANMLQTPNGTLVFGYFNRSTENSEGELVLTSAATYHKRIPVPPLQSAPGLVIYNWQAGNLNVTNTSLNPTTSIFVSAYGPGVPGQSPGPLPIGQEVKLGTTQSAQGSTRPQNMRLRITVSGGATGVFAIVGGPNDASGNNGKVIAVNFRGEKPDDYYAVTPNNSYVLDFNWNGARIYVVNMSSSGSPLGQVLLQAV